MYGVIYMLCNKINSKVYIGQTIDFKQRMREHKVDKDEGYIHNSIRKYGWDNFDKLILDKANNKEELDTLECFYIDKFQSIDFGYNLKDGGSHGLHSLNSKQKMSMSAIGKPKSTSHKQKLAQSHLGKSCSDETKRRMSVSKKGEKHNMYHVLRSEETINRMREANRKNMKPVQCIETGIIFESKKDVSIKMNINRGNLNRHLLGYARCVKGFTFEYI
jgi:group I intron endonuclease